MANGERVGIDMLKKFKSRRLKIAVFVTLLWEEGVAIQVSPRVFHLL